MIEQPIHNCKVGKPDFADSPSTQQAMQTPTTAPCAQALTLHDGDDVAVMVSDGISGQHCAIRNHSGEHSTLLLQTNVPFGHKLAIRSLDTGSVVIKYGQPIGLALEAIAAGAHVHTHNMGGYRSNLRGDKA